jgi:CxxC motif-containing protein (DUF1111 family)
MLSSMGAARGRRSVCAREGHGGRAPSGAIFVTEGIRRPKGVRTMTLRKWIPAAGLSAVLIMLALSVLGSGGGSPPNFGDPFAGLSSANQALFVAGQANFESPDTPETGLGPVFNNTPCAACHTAGAIGGASTITETRVGTVTHGVFNPLPQYTGNVTPSLLHTQGIGTFPTLVTNAQFPVLGTEVDFVGEIVPQPPAVPNGPATIVAGRLTIALFGDGLVDAVSTSTFQAIAAHEKANSPATAGRINMVSDVPADGVAAVTRPGRFGWKTQHSTLFAFAGDAYLNEIGITTPLLPNENPPQDPAIGYLVDPSLLAANPGPKVGPDLTNDPDNSSITQFTQFMTLLAPPPTVALTAQSTQGQQIFQTIGCANCHLPTLKAGPSPIPQINNATFHPFSDFLLHDMGSLGDGIAQAGAGQTEMRTAPLWGARVRSTFLHDGRAKTLSQAILDHAGQGQAAANAFAALSASEQDALIAFLNSI